MTSFEWFDWLAGEIVVVYSAFYLEKKNSGNYSPAIIERF